MGFEPLFVHMLGISMYTKNLYEMLNMDFDGKKNIFATGNPDKRYYSISSDADCQEKKLGKPTRLFTPRFFFLVYRSKKVFLHGLFSFARITFFFLQPWLWKKCHWVVWGGDLYSSVANKNLTVRIKEYMKRKMIPKFGGIITLTVGDQEVVTRKYGYCGDFKVTSYPIPLQGYGMKEKLAKRKNTSCHPVNIVIGNSATETNHHFEALDMLDKFKDEDIHIYLPLAYGFGNYNDYGQKVYQYAVNKFGVDKVTPIFDRMSGDGYTEYMRKMHIAIYNNDRQQAMGNIAIMLAVGAKVYIRTDTNMWSHYAELNRIMYPVESIGGLDYQDFILYRKEDYDHNFNVFFEQNDRQKVVRKWKEIIC